MNNSALQLLSSLIPLTPQKIYLVGGSVRDLLIADRLCKDIDLVMPSGSEFVAQAFAKQIGGSFFFLDEERKITRVVKHEAGEALQFDFTNFEGPDLNADLGRRDFTVNAMALDLRRFLDTSALDGLIDVSQGKEDVRNKLLRVTRPEVLEEDPLRLLRAARFAVTLGFTIEEATAAHIKTRSQRIVASSPERVRDELFFILSENNAEKHLLLLDSLGLLAPLIPELEPLRGFAPGRHHVHDVLMHSIKTAGYIDDVLDDPRTLSPVHREAVLAHLDESLEQHISRKAALRFACLIHDNAKPETYTNAGGRVRFHGHDTVGAEKASAICRRFRLSRDTEKAVTLVIQQHMRLFSLASPGGPSRNALYRYCRDLGAAVPESLFLSQADALATVELMPKERFTDTAKTMATTLEYYYAKFLKVKAAPLVTGKDLIRAGLKPGPKFRELLENISEKQADGTLKDRPQALAYLESLA